MINRDIDAYVQDRLQWSTISLDLYLAIKIALLNRARGLFLYAELAMDKLLELEENDDIRSVVDSIPDNLDLMYARLLADYASKHSIEEEPQLLLMQWMTHSVRPLRLIEIADIPSLFGSCENEDAKGIVRSACGSLLELLRDERLCIIHHSLTDFLTGQTCKTARQYTVLEPGPTHQRLALICLAYLENGCLGDVPQPADPQWNPYAPAVPAPVLAPFTRYAAFTGTSTCNELVRLAWIRQR